jgi:hypothetical protein
MPNLAILAIAGGLLAMMTAVVIRFRSIKATVHSINAMRHHRVRVIILEVGDQRFRLSVNGTEEDISNLKGAQSAVENERMRALNAA